LETFYRSNFKTLKLLKKQNYIAKFDKIEDIVVWQLAIELTNAIYKITNNNVFNKDFALRDQIRKSAISVPSNIAEGFERNSTNQFLYF